MFERRNAYLAAIGGDEGSHEALDDFDVLPVRHFCVSDVLVVEMWECVWTRRRSGAIVYAVMDEVMRMRE